MDMTPWTHYLVPREEETRLLLTGHPTDATISWCMSHLLGNDTVSLLCVGDKCVKHDQVACLHQESQRTLTLLQHRSFAAMVVEGVTDPALALGYLACAHFLLAPGGILLLEECPTIQACFSFWLTIYAEQYMVLRQGQQRIVRRCE